MTKRSLVRRYCYRETYNKIMDWGRKETEKGIIISPNNKDNFPFFLERYIERMDYLEVKNGNSI